MSKNIYNAINRLEDLIETMFLENFVPQGNSKGLDKLAQLYGIDRIRTFARFPNTDEFTLIDDLSYGKEPKFCADEAGFDFKKSLYQRGNAVKNPIFSTLLKNPLIYTNDFEKYIDGLTEVSYTKNEGKTVSQAFICTITSHTTGVMGYFTIEQFSDSFQLSNQDLSEIQSFCNVLMLRIKHDETIKQLKKEEELNNYDDVTELPVLRVFKDKLEQRFCENSMCAILHLDVDKFKYINDIWDFSIGNKILCAIADTIKGFLCENEFCCRINDDKFGICLEYINDEQLNTRIEHINKAFVSMQQKYFPTIKITIICGIYVAKVKMNVNDMLDKANFARRHGKGSYKNTFEFYDVSLDDYNDREKQIEKRTQIALEKRQFMPYFQPKFDLITNEICGVEALARWKTEERMIAPFEFIPIFEKNGFITQLDFEIYDQTFEFMQKCMEKGHKFVPVSLNVSRGHISDDTFLDKFLKLMRKYNIPSNLVELELTENLFAEDNEQLKAFICNIRAEGIQVSIDDFGSAYSSLTLLKDIDVDTVKLDKAFIDNIAKHGSKDEQKDKIIIQNIVRMINELGFKTIFEGIEIIEQVDFLKDTGCNYGQGYIFASPISLEEFEQQFLKN